MVMKTYKLQKYVPTSAVWWSKAQFQPVTAVNIHAIMTNTKKYVYKYKKMCNKNKLFQ